MRINFQQGIIDYPRTGLTQSFLDKTGDYVTLLADNGVTDVAFAHGESNYLLSETTTVNNAWGPITPGVDTWLYWDINKQTGVRTFGFTIVDPVLSGPRPAAVDTLHWYDTINKKMYVAQSGVWREVIRVFAAMVNTATFTAMGSGFPLAPFAGTQVGLTGTTVGVGRIVFDGNGKPIRKTSGQFFTTEDDFFINGSPINTIRLESDVLVVTAEENTAKYQIVSVTAPGKVQLAGYNDIGAKVLALTTEDILTNDAGTVIIQGTVRNIDWDWPLVNAPLWVDPNGLITDVDPHVTDPEVYPIARSPIGRVVAPDTIIFGQGLGVKGDKGDPGGPMVLDDLTDVTITTPASGSSLVYNGTVWIDQLLALNDLTDVVITTPVVNEVLMYNGTMWVNNSIAEVVQSLTATD